MLLSNLAHQNWSTVATSFCYKALKQVYLEILLSFECFEAIKIRMHRYGVLNDLRDKSMMRIRAVGQQMPQG
jgi:hypothetical protein